MKEHVGKKRRKEVRQAVNLKKDMNRALAKSLAVMAACVVLCLVYTALLNLGYLNMGDIIVQAVPLAIVFVGVMFIGSYFYKYLDLRDAFKKHCDRYGVSKEDMSNLSSQDL